MITTTLISPELYRGASWAVGLIAGDRVTAAAYIASGDRAPTVAEFDAALAEIAAPRAEAEAAAASAYAALEAAEAAGDDTAAEAAEAAWAKLAVKVRLGMMSGGEFLHTFTKAESRRLGL